MQACALSAWAKAGTCTPWCPGASWCIGGVEIPFERGLLGHSDADVLLHAITDALLGAAGLGDIGRHFPDTDERFKGADSMVLLAEAARRVRERGLADRQRRQHRDRAGAEAGAPHRRHARSASPRRWSSRRGR